MLGTKKTCSRGAPACFATTSQGRLAYRACWHRIGDMYILPKMAGIHFQRWRFLVLGLGFSLGLSGCHGSSGALVEAFLAALRGEHLWVGGLWLGLLAFIVAGSFGIARWYVLARAQAMDFPLRSMVHHWIFGVFLDGLVGLRGLQAFYRWLVMSQRRGDWGNALVLIGLETILSLGVWVFFSIPMMLYVASVSGAGIAKFNFALVCIALFGVLYCVGTLFHRRLWQIYACVVPLPSGWRQRSLDLLQILANYRKMPGTLVLAFLLSIGQHLAGMAGRLAVLAGVSGWLSGEVLQWYLYHENRLLLGWVVRRVDALQGAVPPTVATDGFRESTMLWQGSGLLILAGAAVLLVRGFGIGTARKAPLSATTLESMEDVAAPYRRALLHCLLAGAAAGLLGGALIGFAVGIWLLQSLVNPEELRLLWWGPLFYGFFFLPVGVALGVMLHFLYVLFQRILPAIHSFGICLGGVLAFSILVIGRWRIARDVLYEQPLEQQHILLVLGSALFAWILCERLLGWAPSRAGIRARTGILMVTLTWLALPLAGWRLEQMKVSSPGPSLRPAVSGDPGPNIILIVADTLRADFLRSINPDARAVTPALDQLAADGVVYRQAIAQSPWTKPSFGTIFTGVTPYEHGAAVKDASLRDNVPTLASKLLEAGYFTAGFPNNPHIPSAFGFGRGFLQYEYLEPNHYLWGRPSVRLLSLYSVLSRVLNFAQGGVPIEHMYQPAQVVTKRVNAWLDKHQHESPFYLFFQYMDPHDPFVPKGEVKSAYARALLGQYPDAGRYREAFIDAYIDEIERMDSALGNFLDKLRALELYDDSLIVFSADHGEEFFEHGGWWHGETLYGELMHIPLIIKYPARFHRKGVEPRLAHHIDIAPTLLEVAGVSPPEQWKGIALGALAPAGAEGNDRMVYMENTFSGTILRGLQSATHKYIENIDTFRDVLPEEIYDLRLDSQEQAPLTNPPASLMEQFYSELLAVGPYFNQPDE